MHVVAVVRILPLLKERYRYNQCCRNDLLRFVQEWLLKGHGEYEELPDERSFFEATKKSSRFVAHFFRPSTDRCKIVDMHLKRIASQHMETRFVRVNAEKVLFM